MQNIKYQIKYINPDLLLWASEDIEQLSDILMEDEKMIHIIDGLFEGTAGLLFSTNSRIIFKGSGVDFIEVIPHEKITLIQYQNSQKIIELYTQEQQYQFEIKDLFFAEQFCKTVNAFIKGEESTELSKDSIFELLERLGKLKQNGILTDEEFTDQKKKLLDKL
ncbi:SHOCT domain-containing protein [Chryseobacterium tructae]|uniref:SHOCT domain-containing protein n=1 Tax=Chryseobacterium tructae TaxID=1037380 RepID=A0ABV7XZF3_9FLAO|nr:SHOCT domain-containing protein [Chryseobacterium tructae]MDN3692878.1 SHOCT domain-containing protein [Chryseobacterium tructae]